MKSNLKLVEEVFLPSSIEDKFKKYQQTDESLEGFFQEFLGSFLSSQTKRAYFQDLKAFFSFMKAGNQNIHHPKDIGGHHFIVYRDDLIEQGLAPATINRKLIAIRSFLKWAVAKKMIDHNPLDAIKLPKYSNLESALAFTDEEASLMISAPDIKTATGNLHRLIMVLLFNLGLRRQELIQIKLKDFSHDRGHLVLKIRGKGDKIRLLPLSEFAKSEIDDYLLRLEGFIGFRPGSEDYLFQSKKTKNIHRPINGSTVYRAIQRYALELGINKKVSPHSCRATVISHLLDTQHVGIRDVADFAGHSNITTTERYDKKRKGLDQSAAYKVNLKD